MSSSILTFLDNVDKAIVELEVGIQRRNFKSTRAGLEGLIVVSDTLKSLLPEDFVEENFRAFDRHLHFIGYYLDKGDFEWIESNFDDIREYDFPDIKTEIHHFIVRGELPKNNTIRHPCGNDIFLVHGRDKKSLMELKTMLEEFGLNPIILHEQPSASRTIVEKLERYSDVGYAFVILTPDDLGTYRSSLSEPAPNDTRVQDSKTIVLRARVPTKGLGQNVDISLRPRSRQNVILEFGYFIGKLGRDRVCCLHTGDVELPSDMHGIIYLSFEKSVKKCREMIIRELRAAGYKIRT